MSGPGWKRDLARVLFEPVLPWTSWFVLCLGFHYSAHLRILPTWAQVAIGIAAAVALIAGSILTAELRGAKHYRSCICKDDR